MLETSLVNKRDLQALTLAGPTVTKPVKDTLTALSLDHRLYKYKYFLCSSKYQGTHGGLKCSPEPWLGDSVSVA